MNSIKDTIRARKSVRSFDGRELLPEDKSKLEKYISEVGNPFGVDVDFKLLEAESNDLSSPVIVGCNLYLAAKVKRVEHYELAFGYSFEKACLYARTLGIGTVMLAASLSRKTFEKALGIRDDEVMPVASPVGYPAKKRSIRDSLMRKGLKADERLPFDELFFENDFGGKISSETEITEALEMARLAPSAGNKQPWRAVVCGDTVHFYEHKTLKDSPLGDIQKVDIGIALAHFDLTLREKEVEGRFTEADPEIPLPENTHYIISYKKAK